MDEYMFQHHLKSSIFVAEDTRYVEILNYTNTEYNTCEEHPLSDDEFENFVRRQGAFAPPKLPEKVRLLSGIRIILQQNAQVNETFQPRVLSLSKPQYEVMIREMCLPLRAIEGTSIVGPFFWSAYDQNDEDPNLLIVYRKSDVKKKGKTRGWEMMLSHNFRTAVTAGFVKGTPNAKIPDMIAHLKACTLQIAHPLLLPVIVFSHDMSLTNDQKQRDARDWLRQLEHAITMRQDIQKEESFLSHDDTLDLNAVNRDLVECHSQVLWKRPQAYQAVIKEIVAALAKFRMRVRDMSPPPGPKTMWPPGDLVAWNERLELDKLHRSMLSRLEFYRLKLIGSEHYAYTSLERLKIQRESLYNVIAQRESRINLQIAGEQKRLALASKRDGTVMKTLSLLGAVFLPGTYLASVFSMTFFNFETKDGALVSPLVWIYFAICIPVTVVIVAGWVYWDKRRETQNSKDAEDLEKSIDQMGTEIMQMIRRRTLKKENTWSAISPPPV